VRLAAKRPEAGPDLDTDCEASLWMDGSVHILDDRTMGRARRGVEEYGFALRDHLEDRGCFSPEPEHLHGRAEHGSVRTALALSNGLGRVLRLRRRGSVSASEAPEG